MQAWRLASDQASISTRKRVAINGPARCGPLLKCPLKMEPSPASGESRLVPVTPRLLTATQTATYLGYRSTAILRSLPLRPLRLSTADVGCAPRWDRTALDRWLDELSDLGRTTTNDNEPTGVEAELNQWRARRGC